MEPRGRGRARGGRGKADFGGQQGGKPGGGQPRPQGGEAGPYRGGPPQGAWGRPPQAQQPAMPPQQGAWGQRPPAPQSMMGRGSRPIHAGGGEPVSSHVEEPVKVVSSAGDVPGDGNAQASRGGGNGGVRGRSNRNEVINTRPLQHKATKKGTSGQKIPLSANFFKFIQHGKWCLYQYRVDFNPEIDDTKEKKRYMWQAMAQVLSGYLFDGTVLFSPYRLEHDITELYVQKEGGENVQIRVKLVGDLAWGEGQYIQVFNIIMRKCLTLLRLQLVGRNYFDPATKVDIPEHKLQLWPGYYTSIRQHEQDIMMNAELTFKVMRRDTVYDLLLQCERDRNPRTSFQNKVLGSVVLTYYNNRTYTVDDIDFQANPRSTFQKADGSSMSYIDYYKRRYNINIQVPTQPMLISRSKPREIRAGMPEIVFLVPELCQLTGLTDDQRANFQLMSSLATHTRVGPQQRIQKLVEFVNRLTSNQEVVDEIRRWDLKLAETIVQFEGRVLEREKIYVANNKCYDVGPNADWTKELRSNQMIQMGRMERLAVITPAKLGHATEDFMKTLQTAAGGMKWNVGNFRIFSINDDRTASYLDKIEEVVNSANPTMVLLVLQTNSQDRYSAIKKKCCVDRGIPTQVVLAKNLKHKNVMSISTKVAIQMNCKIGGAPWSVSMPLKSLMVVGYDVCRDTANKKKSFSGMVASINPGCTRFYSNVAEHEYEQELSDNFAAFLVLACHKWKELNGSFPERILIYRDGVGEGQLPYVFSHEIEIIKSKLESEIYTANNFKMAFVVVSKRINTRIFHRGDNPPPGTVVDDVITQPERYDFFIVSQCTRQGTVAPTSYNVIFDTMGLPPDRMQILTYKMTHMYYNWSGTVRVPAPCQYAHKLSFLVAQSLHRPAHKRLDTLLYYL